MTQGTTRSDTTRFPNGIATNEIQQNLGQFILPDPTKVYTVFDDFTDLPGNAPAVTWFLEQLQGTGTFEEATGEGGVAIITPSANLDDGTQIEKVSTSFLFEAGKQTWFKSKFKVADTLLSTLTVGLKIKGSATTDGVFFRKAVSDQTLQLVVVKGGTETVTDVLEMADETYVTVGYYYDGYDKISIFSDNEGVGKSVITNMPAVLLTPMANVINGAAVAKVLSIDYIFASKQR
jgi:hypothetical protein